MAPRRPKDRVEGKLRSLLKTLPTLLWLMIMLPPGQASAEHLRELVRYGDVEIDVIVEGNGPAIVLLPSLARDSEDYDEVASGLAAAGLPRAAPTTARDRPQPRSDEKYQPA